MDNKCFLIGSKILNLSNCKDIDYLILDDNKNNIYNQNNADYRYKTITNIKETLEFKNDDGRKLFNYQLDRTINKEFGEFIPYNILDYRNELIKFLKEIASNKMFNFNKRVTTNNGHCSKIIYHIAYNLFILENNSPIITDKQKAIIQKIHDRLMPIEYIDELEKRINNLK